MKHLTCDKCGASGLRVEWDGPPVPKVEARNQLATFICLKCGHRARGRATHPNAKSTHTSGKRGGAPSWMDRLNR
jgi:ribosomal protein L40E